MIDWLIASRPQKGTTGQTTNRQHYAIAAGMLNPAIVAHSAPVRTIVARPECSPPPRCCDPVQDGQAYDVGCRALQGDEAHLPGGLGAAVQGDGAGGQAEHGVPVGQGVARIQRPGQSGMGGRGGPLALGLVQDGVRGDDDERWC